MNHQNRRRLHRLLKGLFQKWKLTESEQERLLGVSLSQWGKTMSEEGLEGDQELLARAVSLLKIHSLLRVLFPENADLRYQWITTTNRSFNQRTPLNVISDYGHQGLASVIQYLQAATQV